MADFSSIIGQISNKLRKSIQEMSDELGVTYKTISNYMKGTSEPSYEVVQKLVKTYGINPYYLLFGEGPILQSEIETPQVVATASGSNSNAVASGGDTKINGATAQELQSLQDLIEEKEKMIDRLTQSVADLTASNRLLMDRI